MGARVQAWRRGFPGASSSDRRSRTLLVPNEPRAACEKPSHTENSEKSLEVTSNLSVYSSPWYRLRCESQGESHLSVTKIGQFYARVSSAPRMASPSKTSTPAVGQGGQPTTVAAEPDFILRQQRGDSEVASHAMSHTTDGLVHTVPWGGGLPANSSVAANSGRRGTPGQLPEPTDIVA